MYPSSPSQPPKPPGTPAKELPGIAKKPTAPFRGQAPTPLTLRDVAVSRAQTPPPQRAQTPPQRAQTPAATPTAPSQPKAIGAPPKPPQAAPPVPSARPVGTLQKEPLGGPMADDRLQAMQNMRAKAAAPATAAPSQTTGAAMAMDPERMTAQAKTRAITEMNAENAAKNAVLNEGGSGMDLTGLFGALGDKSKRPNETADWEWKEGQYGDPGMWHIKEQGASLLPPGVKPGDPGSYFEGGEWRYDQKKALEDQNLPYTANDLLMGDETQFLMTPEERAAAEAELDKSAAASQWAQGNTMAAHGLGGSGVAMTGLGDIAAKRMTAQNELNTSDRAQAMAAYMDKLGLVLPATQNATNEADKMALAEAANKTDAERWEYQKEQDALANKWTAVTNAWGLSGADQLDSQTMAAGLRAYELGDVAFAEWLASTGITANGDGTATLGQPGAMDNTAPAGFTGDWSKLSDSERALYTYSYNAGFGDPSVPPPGTGHTTESWKNLSVEDKMAVLKSQEAPATFKGTQSEWNALPPEQRKKYYTYKNSAAPDSYQGTQEQWTALSPDEQVAYYLSEG